MSVDVIVEAGDWDEAAFTALAEAACTAALRHLALDPDRFEISLLACDDARIADLNADFRGKPTPTNVLSWPAEEIALPLGERPDLPTAPAGGPPVELGDIAIAHETCEREARDLGRPFAHHLSHLLVHGTLHLLGFDHINDADAAVMERLETRILATLGVPAPY